MKEEGGAERERERERQEGRRKEMEGDVGKKR